MLSVRSRLCNSLLETVSVESYRSFSASSCVCSDLSSLSTSSFSSARSHGCKPWHFLHTIINLPFQLIMCSSQCQYWSKLIKLCPTTTDTSFRGILITTSSSHHISKITTLVDNLQPRTIFQQQLFCVLYFRLGWRGPPMAHIIGITFQSAFLTPLHLRWIHLPQKVHIPKQAVLILYVMLCYALQSN